MVIISNGFNRFHLAVAAAEAHRRGMLDLFLTGAYPTSAVGRFIKAIGLDRRRKVARLLDREEAIPERLVHPFWLAEAVHHAAQRLPDAVPLRGLRVALDVFSLRFYGWLAIKPVERMADAKVYHYRAGFGGLSVARAKARGMVVLCDHSIAHPEVVEYLVANDGRFPPRGAVAGISAFWRCVLGDVNQADAVLVNSDFVKETFVHQGWRPHKVHVIYWGIDDRFLEVIPPRPAGPPCDPAQPLRLFFAGTLERRKGAEELLVALRTIGDAFPWSLDIAGGIEPAVARRFADVLDDARVRRLGTLSRADLAARMSTAEVFVFCSRAEGSARVVFEALACGCYVVTTPNSGSIVEDGVHGALVPPGDPEAVAAALRHAFDDRHRLAEIGRCNAALVRERYRQRHLGDALESLYRRLAAGEKVG
jgi:glycosyltransferase involved in cell wall biosynthesis